MLDLIKNYELETPPVSNNRLLIKHHSISESSNCTSFQKDDLSTYCSLYLGNVYKPTSEYYINNSTKYFYIKAQENPRWCPTITIDNYKHDSNHRTTIHMANGFVVYRFIV